MKIQTKKIYNLKTQEQKKKKNKWSTLLHWKRNNKTRKIAQEKQNIK